MSNKKIIFAILFSISLLTVNGQLIEIRPEVGIGTYSMSDLKGLLTQFVLQSQLGIKTTDNFPAYVFYGLDVIQTVSSNFGMGITMGFYSTGGRNNYTDYSGSYSEDIKVNSRNLGLLASFNDSIGKNSFFNLEVASGIKFSSVTIKNELKLTEYLEDNSYDFRSEGWWIKPQIRIGRNFIGKFSCSVFAGYEFNLKSKVISKENSQNYLTAKIDWSGIRTGISICYKL